MPDLLWLNDGGAPNISAHEVLNSRVENHTVSGIPTINVTLEVNATDSYQFITRLLKSYCNHPISNAYRATDARVRVFEGDVSIEEGGEIITYSDNVLIDVVYTAVPGKVTKDVQTGIYYYVEEDIDPRSESFKMGTQNIIWGNLNGAPGAPAKKEAVHPDEAPPIQIGGWTLVRTIKGYATANVNWANLIAKTNVAQYVSSFDGITYAIGTLLLRSLQLKRTSNDYNYATPSMLVIVKYEYRVGGWNMFWRFIQDGTTGFYDLRDKATGLVSVTPFPTADQSPFLF